ncbi:unnamed protein product [Arabidopsis halleri]
MSMQIFEKITIPFFVLHGEADTVTDPEISKAQYEKASTFWSLSFNGPQVSSLFFIPILLICCSFPYSWLFGFFFPYSKRQFVFMTLQKENCISLRDLKASKLSGNVLNRLFNLNKFMASETYSFAR